MDAHTSASGVPAPEAIVVRDTGSDKRGTGIIALASTNAHLELIAAINAEHRLAIGSAKEALQHAFRCGELLTSQKKKLPHGEFAKWIATNCEFAYSTAARYMTAARQNLYGVEIPSLSALFPSGRKTTKKTISTEEMATVTEAKTAPIGLMSGVPTTRSQPPESPKASVELAVKVIKAAVLARKIRSPRCVEELTSLRARATKLRNDLARIEQELHEAERQVIVAYKGLKDEAGIDQAAKEVRE